MLDENASFSLLFSKFIISPFFYYNAVKKNLTKLINTYQPDVIHIHDYKIFIIRLKSRAGTNTSYGLAHIYESRERALQIEPKYIIERNEGKKQEEKEAE